MVWGLKICLYSMMRSWPNKLGACSMTSHLYSTMFSRRSSSLIPQLWRQKFQPTPCMLGSIMKGRSVIKRGAKWRIGSCRSIHIWGENWLRKSCNPKVLSPQIKGRVVSMVCDLIDLDLKEWKTDVIDSLFYEFEAALIKNIPLCRSI